MVDCLLSRRGPKNTCTQTMAVTSRSRYSTFPAEKFSQPSGVLVSRSVPLPIVGPTKAGTSAPLMDLAERTRDRDRYAKEFRYWQRCIEELIEGLAARILE